MKLLSFALFLIFFTFDPCSALTQSDYLITDLENKDSSGFTNEANSWVYKGQPCPSCIFSMPSGSSCAQEDQMVYGGPDSPAGTAQVSFARSYSVSGTPWSYFGVEFELWAFTTSELSNTPVLSIRMTGSSGYFGSTFLLIGSCSIDYQSTSGSQIKHIYKYLVRTTPNNSPVNTISFQILKSATSSAVIDSLGFRNVKIYNMGSSSASTSSVNFPCFDSYFWDGTGCRACQSSCLSCTGPNQGQCTVCKANSYNYGNGYCLGTLCSGAYQLITGSTNCTKKCSTGFYWARNTSCVESCEEPLVQSLDPTGGAPICSSPCSDPTQFVYPDGSCLPTCNPLLKDIREATIKLCLNPCKVIGFMYPDGSCDSTCPTYLEQKIEKNVKYCESPCSDPTQFVYSDRSCSSQCPYPLSSREEPTGKYCFSPCDDYLYKNGSCLQSCHPPYIKSQSYNVDQCLSPCEDPNQEYFYEADQVCKSTCTSPYESKTVDGVKVCSQTEKETEQIVSSMTAQEVEETERMVSSMKSQGQVTEAGMKAASALSSRSPSFAWLAGQASMLFYIRYINLKYTPKLKLVFSLQDTSPFDFTVGMNMPEGLKEKLRDRELPEIFERFEVHSNFFYNSWDMLSSFLLILGIILVFSLVKMFTAKYTKVDRVLAGVLGSLKWNTLLMVIFGSFGKIFFDASLQFQAGYVDSAGEVLSIILAIAMIFIGMAILALNGKVVRDLWRSRNVKDSREEMEKKWKNFELFFESCERSSLASFGCMGIFLGRTLVFNLIIANLYNYPLVQSILINIITFGMAGYLISKRPLKNLLEFAQILLSEVFVVIVNTCALIIAIMDQAQIEGQGLRNDLCNTIIIIFSMFTSVSLAFLVIQVLVALFLFVRILRILKAQGQLHLRGVLNALFEENTAVEEKNNGTKLPVQIQPERKLMREISHNQSDSNMTNNNETESRQETSRIFISHRSSSRRIISVSRNIHPSSSILDRSAIQILPSDGSFHHTLGSNLDQKDLSPGLNQQVTLESDNRDSVVRTVDPEKRDLGLPDFISQYRKMRNYLRKNRNKKQQE